MKKRCTKHPYDKKIVWIFVCMCCKDEDEFIPNTEPRMIPMPRPLLITIFRQSTKENHKESQASISLVSGCM